MKKKSASWIYIAAPLAVLAALLLGNTLWLDHWIDADMAAEMIFSRLLSETGHLIASPDWYYSTEFRIAYTQLLMVPLFHVFHSWHLIRMIVNICFYVFLLLAFLYMMKPAGIGGKKVFLSSALLFIPFSETLAQHVQFGNTYMAHLIILFLTVGMVLSLTVSGREADFGRPTGIGQTKKSDNRKSVKISRGITGLFLILLSFISGASGVRYLMSVQTPLLLAGFWMAVQSRGVREVFSDEGHHPASIQEWRKVAGDLWTSFGGRVLRYSLLSTLFALAGYVFNVTYIRSHYIFTTYESTNFVRIYKGIFYERVSDVFGCLLELFGYIPDRSVLSLRGLITVLSFVLLICMFRCCLRLLKLFKKGAQESAKTASGPEEDLKDEVRRFYPLFFLTSFGVMFFILTFTNTTLTARYFVLPVFLFPAMLAVYLETEKNTARKGLFLLILVLALSLAGGKIMLSLRGTDKNRDRKAVCEFLLKEGYEFGFALYQDANLLQELTDGQLVAAGITDPETVSFFRWSTAAGYYEKEYHQGKVFCLLPEGNAELQKGILTGKPMQEIYRDHGYVIYSLEDGSAFYEAQE